MAKKKSSNKKRVVNKEQDTTYFLKLTLFLILGSQWIFIENLPDWQIPIPAGLVIGLVFATHEQFQIDRKIEYALLLLSAFVAFWLPIGLVIKV